jgi:hypothetical protein
MCHGLLAHDTQPLDRAGWVVALVDGHIESRT